MARFSINVNGRVFKLQRIFPHTDKHTWFQHHGHITIMRTSLGLCNSSFFFGYQVSTANFVQDDSTDWRCRHSDRTGERFFHIVTPLFVGIIGFVIAIATMNLAARYIAL